MSVYSTSVQARDPYCQQLCKIPMSEAAEAQQGDLINGLRENGKFVYYKKLGKLAEQQKNTRESSQVEGEEFTTLILQVGGNNSLFFVQMQNAKQS